MSNKLKDFVPETDPYDVLGVDLTATEADITKAYRKLALKLHPDKQSDPSQAEKTAIEFHKVQQARAFLLDAEYAEARTKYQSRAASMRARKQADAAREQTMSVNRKRMREELKRQEEEAGEKETTSRSKTKQAERVDDLRREGSRMRDAYAGKQAEEESKRESKQLKKEKRDLEDRQVRMKWSRKKMGFSPSEHSLAKLLERFGVVEQVEMIGSKGNAALVTFQSEDSCSKCVKAYADSDEMRASFVGKRKGRDDDATFKAGVEAPLPQTATARDVENVNDWKLRRAAEKEKLLRQMEAEDENTVPVSSTRRDDRPDRTYPPPFPANAKLNGLTPVEKLELFEERLLDGIVDSEFIRSLKQGSDDLAK